jgi:hypothetical protein
MIERHNFITEQQCKVTWISTLSSLFSNNKAVWASGRRYEGVKARLVVRKGMLVECVLLPICGNIDPRPPTFMFSQSAGPPSHLQAQSY